ncbi:beta-lactamase family protein [Colwellia sp. MSW7]|uniref:Beta-lactamase family protein n=1 Tax=Colwellia maritima TaxID=2912588 RepID=A0ABS9X204_9GAMM|nr:serine hydrolase domain-containing protein [Colwellia maritima]MCI2284236.1 beta-lactamase family protein [Colwellia maritima]
MDLFRYYPFANKESDEKYHKHYQDVYRKTKLITSLFLATILTTISSCGGSGKDSINTDEPSITLTNEQNMHAALDTANTDTDFTMLIESNNGTQFTHSTGESTNSTFYRSASTSKIVTATVILSLVQQGVLSLDDHPQNYIEFWPSTGNHALITLKHLLSFTSGLSEEPLCLNLPNANFTDCVESILNKNSSISSPGTEFYYASTHLQIAGLMAIRASGLSNWQQVFNNFTLETQLFSHAVYDLPSQSNPRLAGGMHWQATEYLDFLRALYQQQVLSAELIDIMMSDHTNNANFVYSPVSDDDNLSHWHYGLGLWLECSSDVLNCTTPKRVSSLGAYGAYPFIDFEHKYFGIIAREGNLGTSIEGYKVWTLVENELAEWADSNL